MLLRIDRYILKHFNLFFLSGLIVFVVLFLVFDVSSMMVRYQMNASTLVRYYIYFLPKIIYQMFPMACLIATVFTIGSLSRSNELVALYSTGMSLARVSAPILAWVAILSVAFFWTSDRILPVFSKKKNYVYYVEIRKQPGLFSTVKTNKIWYRSQNILFNLNSLNPQKKKAQGVTFYYFDDSWDLAQVVSGKELFFHDQFWELAEGTVTLFDKNASFPLTISFKTKKIYVNEKIADVQKASETSDSLSLKDLAGFISKNKVAGLDTIRYEVDYHAKLSFGFSAFVLAFIGIPFSVGKVRSVSWAKNAGMCLLMSVVFWAMHSSGLTLGRHSHLPPIVATWAPNITMMIISLGFLLRLRR